MENFPAYYTMLFNAITEALRLIEQEQYDDAFLLLTDAQVRSENAYIEDGGEPVDPEEYESQMRETSWFDEDDPK